MKSEGEARPKQQRALPNAEESGKMMKSIC